MRPARKWRLFKVKRQRWARLRTTAFGIQFKDDDPFVEHTVLMITEQDSRCRRTRSPSCRVRTLRLSECGMHIPKLHQTSTQRLKLHPIPGVLNRGFEYGKAIEV